MGLHTTEGLSVHNRQFLGVNFNNNLVFLFSKVDGDKSENEASGCMITKEMEEEEKKLTEKSEEMDKELIEKVRSYDMVVVVFSKVSNDVAFLHSFRYMLPF